MISYLWFDTPYGLLTNHALDGALKFALGRANGNTAQLEKSFADGAKSAGHTVETISLLQNEVKGCLGCNACRYGKHPIISGGHSPSGSLPPATPAKDAFNSIIPKIKESDCTCLHPRYICGLFRRCKLHRVSR